MFDCQTKIDLETAANTKPGKVAVIIGAPASGKTYFADELKRANSRHKLFRTDDYMNYGFKEALPMLLMDIATHVKKYKNDKFIIEGVTGYRLLRSLAQVELHKGRTYFTIDTIFEIHRPVKEICAVYKSERRADVHDALNMDRNNSKIIADYYDIQRRLTFPKWFIVENSAPVATEKAPSI